MKINKSRIIFIILVILIGVYFSGTFYYRNKFPRRVYVNEVNIGGMSLKNADKKIKEVDSWDRIIVKSDTEEFLEIRSDEIDYKYIESLNLPKIFKEENKRNWFLAMFKDSIYFTPILYDYNKDKVKTKIDSMEELDKKLSNASIVYSSRSNAFVIEDHSYEINISKEHLFNLIDEAILKKYGEINIENNIEQPSIFANDKSLIAARDQANEYLNIELKYDFGDRTELVDASILKNFFTFQGTEVDIDPKKVKEYVIELARKYDTYGRGRKFTTSKDENIIISGGSYGWVIHRDKTVDSLIEHIKDGKNKTIEPVYSFEALIRNSDDIGNSYVEIDLKEQMVYVYLEGQLEIKTPTVTGNVSRGFDTPTGIYPLNYKERDAILRGEDYASPVKYWMPFNKNIGLHDADWRSVFGGDIYKKQGSNGCINLPPEDAKTIFDLVYPGMPVIVH